MRYLREIFTPPTVFLAALLMMPNLKSDDERVKFAVISPSVFKWAILLTVLFFAVRTAARTTIKVRGPILMTLGLFTLFALSAFYNVPSEYADDKVPKLFTITLLTALSPIFLIRDPVALRRLFGGLALGGLIYGTTALVGFIFGSSQYRLTALSSNPITIGRAAGVTFLVVSVSLLEGRLKAWVGLPLAVLTFVMVLGSGSRGPLLAALGALGLTIIAVYRSRLTRRTWAGMGIVAGALIGAGAFMFSLLPKVATERLGNFMSGDFGESESARVDSFQQSLDLIAAHPFGIGMGSYDAMLDLWRDGEKLNYPHNIILEILLECGWIAGVIFLVILVRGFFRGYKTALLARTEDYGLRMLLCITIFATVNAMVSGDLNSNRTVFALLNLCLISQEIAEHHSELHTAHE